MKPVFDKNGLATEPGDIRCFYYDPDTGNIPVGLTSILIPV
jgi:hypothetical protein